LANGPADHGVDQLWGRSGFALIELVGALAISADGDGALVLTDLPGATPHNLAAARRRECTICRWSRV
jgi:mannose/fructose-specific phosphotransferase system component IIA